MFGKAEDREAEFVYARLRELKQSPIQGDFDTRHLTATHAYIFQDLPHHRPGKLRDDSPAWYKNRQLEDQSIEYRVDYVPAGVAKRVDEVLKEFGGPSSLAGTTSDNAACLITRLYGDLDQAHGFYEGNSRTLREFTRTLALTAGYKLDWVSSGVDAESRNRLYIARDILVLERTYPGLTAERADKTQDPVEYQAFSTLTSLHNTGVSLDHILRKSLVPISQYLREQGSIKRTPPEAGQGGAASEIPGSNSIGSRAVRLARQLAREFSSGRETGGRGDD